jgi:Predicted periplasmic protein
VRTLLFAALQLAATLYCYAAPDRFTTIPVNVREENVELFLRDESGRPFHRFDRLAGWLKARDRELVLAMNAGMFHADFSPVGLLVTDARQIAPLNLAAGVGNFFLRPNGVFLVTRSGPRIVESSEYPGASKGVRLATQSGPLLVRHGAIHPAFSPTSKSRLIRNGVGVRGGEAVFVISEQPVTFYELAIYFRDELRCPDALYLDGVVSSLHSAKLRRSDSKVDLGPIIAVVR